MNVGDIEVAQVAVPSIFLHLPIFYISPLSFSIRCVFLTFAFFRMQQTCHDRSSYWRLGSLRAIFVSKQEIRIAIYLLLCASLCRCFIWTWKMKTKYFFPFCHLVLVKKFIMCTHDDYDQMTTSHHERALNVAEK